MRKVLAVVALLLAAEAAQAHGIQRVQVLGVPSCVPAQSFRSTLVFERQEVLVPREVLVPQQSYFLPVQPRLGAGCYGGGVGVDSFLFRESRFGGRLRVSTPGFFLSIR